MDENTNKAVETAETAAAPLPSGAPIAATVDAVVQSWVIRHIYSSPVSRNTEAYNHLAAVLPHLCSDLTTALTTE